MSENLQILLLTAHILLGICLISLILIQKSKGSDMGAAFGGGASDTVFGARGAATFLTRTTAILATLFFITSFSLAYVHRAGGAASNPSSVFDTVEETTDSVVPEATLPSDIDGLEIPAPDVELPPEVAVPDASVDSATGTAAEPEATEQDATEQDPQ